MLGNMRRVASTTNKLKPTAGDGKKKTGPPGENNDLSKGKRQGDSLQDPTQKRRAAFGDITNAYADKPNIKDALKKSKIPTQKPTVVVKAQTKENKVRKEKKTKSTATKTASSGSKQADGNSVSLSQESLSSQDSSSSSSQDSLTSSQESVEDLLIPVAETCGPPEGVEDVDKENLNDPVQCSLYAFDIFNYYKEREMAFVVEPYMSKQKYLTASMRAILVDWLVEVQENFELNHETLYLAVKLVDLYVSKKSISKEILQLVGAAALFIACKFDERCPPLVEDFLYICDDAYKRNDFLAMERSILINIGFDIGMPLSYRFLRRYAKCCKASMETLTLGRYILEMSLMEYNFINVRESKMAAASLLLALKMKQTGEWTKQLEYYTGYTSTDLTGVVRRLNTYIKSPPKQLNTIISKYSHKVFYEVAKTPTLEMEAIV